MGNNPIGNTWGLGFADQTYAQWFLFLLFFVFAWAFVVAIHQKVGAAAP